MMLLLLSLIPLSIAMNMLFYELRVVKRLFKDPQYISNAYSKLMLQKRYK